MPRFFTQKLTKEELAAKIVAAASVKKTPYHNPVLEPQSSDIETVYVNSYRMGLPVLTEQVIKDLAKVQFDSENHECRPDEAFCGAGEIAGFRTLPNGLTYLGCTAGGDWECPLFYIIYWDGKKLRGYIPKDGNFWNTDLKAAYGNDEEEFDQEGADAANIKKRFGVEVEHHSEFDQDFDCDKLIADIENRIQAN